MFPWLLGRERLGVRLRPLPASHLSDSASKIGGSFRWPAGRPIPKCRRPEWQGPAEYVCVLQLRADEFPEVAFPRNRDLLQLLWCPQHGPAECRARWFRLEDLARDSIEVPASKPDGCFVPKLCSVRPERVLEYPDYLELPRRKLREVLNWEPPGFPPGAFYGLLYDLELSTAPGCKVAGYANWLQFAERSVCSNGHRMTHLATIATREFDVPHQRWRPHLGRETPARIALLAQPAGLNIDDSGAAFFQYCQKCPTRPVRCIGQSL